MTCHPSHQLGYRAFIASSNLRKTGADDTLLLLTAPTLTGEAKDEADALLAETKAGIAEVVAEANSNIDEAVAEAADEDGANNAAELTAELNAIVDQSCKAIVNL